MRVNDISVSRTHALIKYRKEDGIYLSDNKSKFGTLILMRQASQLLEQGQDYLFQVGRTVCSLRVATRIEPNSSSSLDKGEFSNSVEHGGQTEPFCSSQSSEEGEEHEGHRHINNNNLINPER